MCGISGYIDFKKNIDSDSIIKKMNTAIKHRGPDGEGSFTHKHTSIGHVRLSIIDLDKKSNQPMFSGDGNLALSFNGEIYNYKALKTELSNYSFKTNSDSEVILAAYIKWGEKCLKKLNGMFSFVIYDKKKETLFGARDAFGIKPFYYHKSNDFFIFSSEIKGILSTEKIEAKLNKSTFYDFVAFNRTDHLEDTCFTGVKNLRPGCCININIRNKKNSIRQWHSNYVENEHKLLFKEVQEQLKKKLKNSVSLHLISDVEVGSALSGGIDSSTIVGLIRKIDQDRTINVFSAVYDEKWERDEKIYVDEVVKEKKLSAHYVFPNGEDLLKDLEKLIYQQEEPFASASIFAGWSVYKKATEEKIKVLLNGQGADEIFGYDYMAAYYFKELFFKLKWIKLFKELYFFIAKQASVNFTLKLFVFLLAPKIVRNKMLNVSSNIINNKFFKDYNSFSKFNSEFFKSKGLNESAKKHLEMKLHHLLRTEDKNSMMFGVEARVPFLEKELVEFVLKIPSCFKIKKGSIKHILKESAKSILPKLIYERNNKIGYETPMGKWLNSDSFQKEIDNMIESTDQPMEKYLNLRYIKKKWKTHKSNKGDYSSEIWKYFYLTKWYNIYFK